MTDNPAGTPQVSSNEAFQSFLKNVTNALKDASELTVLTFSGNVSATTSGSGAKGSMNWDKWVEDFTNLKGDLQLVAATNIQLDGDTYLFVSENAPEALYQAHLEATAAAQKYREGIIKAVGELVGG
jgi:hypothetical protein